MQLRYKIRLGAIYCCSLVIAVLTMKMSDSYQTIQYGFARALLHSEETINTCINSKCTPDGQVTQLSETTAGDAEKLPSQTYSCLSKRGFFSDEGCAL
jgi:hypothetical protein